LKGKVILTKILLLLLPLRASQNTLFQQHWENMEVVMEEWIHCILFIFLSAEEVQNFIKK